MCFSVTTLWGQRSGVPSQQTSLPASPVVAPIPTVSTQITGPGPMFESLMELKPGDDLVHFGYESREYFVSGMAAGEPYRTRIVIRAPSNPQRVSGLVLAESMHPSGNAWMFAGYDPHPFYWYPDVQHPLAVMHQKLAQGLPKMWIEVTSHTRDLSRAVERYTLRLEDLAGRYAVAASRGDAKSMSVFERDRAQAAALLESSRESLERAEQDSQLLMEAASDLGARVSELRVERESASARLTVGGLVSEAMRERVERFEKVLAVDAARDEIERAHALADIYREERGEKGG